MRNAEKSRVQARIQSFGGTGGLVTGSCHRIEIHNSRFLVDVGMFQGKFEERSAKGVRRNLTPMREVAEGVTDVVVTHSHIDHMGKLPVLPKNGFRPRVLATRETAAFMGPLLVNSAEIQATEEPGNRLYSERDVAAALRLMTPVEAFKKIPIGAAGDGINAELVLNGHVSGSASVFIRSPEGRHNILLTGDMGKPNQSLCGGYKDFADRFPQNPIHTLVVESTSFDRQPVSFNEKKRALLSAIEETWANGGNPLMPTLSFHRAQEIMEIFHNCQLSGEIPSDCLMVVDAPLAIKILQTYRKLGLNHLSRRYGDDPDFYKTEKSSMERFDLKNLTIISTHARSQEADMLYANYPRKVIIIASGGMGGYGRSVNYLHGNFGRNPKNKVILTCYQVPGTEGAVILEKKKVEGGGRGGAGVVKIEGLTSHVSGPRETFGFLEKFNLGSLKKIIITHGRNEARKAMAAEFKRRGIPGEIILSEIGQEIIL